jgi:hypothetical protein
LSRVFQAIPAKPAYYTSCINTLAEISEGSTVDVTVSRFNRRSVAIQAG